MKRQNLRFLLIFASFLLFPIIQWYFSPFLIIKSALEGIVNGSFIVFGLFIVIGFIFGRGACGWIMPCGGFQECLFAANNKPADNKKMYRLKYIIWGIWIAVIVVSVIGAGGYRSVNFLYQIPNIISIDQPWKYIVYYIVVILFFVMSVLFGRRASCHYICWVCPFMLLGRKLRNLVNTPALQLECKSEKCISCKLCDKNCPMSLSVQEMVKSNRMESAECILCGKCADVCPKDVIHLGFGRARIKDSEKPDGNRHDK